MSIKEPTAILREKIELLRQSTYTLEKIYALLYSTKVGELIAAEYEDGSEKFYMGRFKSVSQHGDNIVLEVSNVAAVWISNGKYNLKTFGNAPLLLRGGDAMVGVRKITADTTEIDKALHRYGFSLADYMKLY